MATHVELFEVAVDEKDRQRPERQVDPEDPAPAELLGEIAAEQGAGDAGDRIDRRDVALIFAHLPRRYGVGNHGKREGNQTAASQPLQHPCCQQGRQILRESTGHRARQKQADADIEHPHPTKEIAQLAVEGQHGGSRQQVGGDHPGEGGTGMQLGANHGQRGGDDALFQ